MKHIIFMMGAALWWLCSAAWGQVLLPEERIAPALPVMTAMVQTGQQWQTISANRLGLFERVMIAPGLPVPVRAPWPGGKAGEKIVVSVEDGGQISADNRPAGKGQRVLVVTLDDKNQAGFWFHPEDGLGVFRVTLRGKGMKTCTLQFWSGPEMPFRDLPAEAAQVAAGVEQARARARQAAEAARKATAR